MCMNSLSGTHAENPDSLTAAEFTALRESLHLPVAWLADRWGVRRQSVLRWQSGERAIPDQIAADLELLASDTDRAVLELSARGLEVIEVPKGDGDAEDGMPKAWHRMVGRRAASASALVRLSYPEDSDTL